MTGLVDSVRQLKSRAMAARDAGNYAEAVELLESAERLLRSALADLAAHRAAGEPAGSHETDLAGQLVHILGTRGGVYRRDQKYEAAVAAYDAGYRIERSTSGYAIVDSYAMTQRLVTRLLLNPSAADEDGVLVLGLDMRQALSAAEVEIQRQVAGERADDEYAAADLAVVRLLLGVEGWEEALETFLNGAPEPYAVIVTQATLRELVTVATALMHPPAALTERLNAACEDLDAA